MNAFSWIEAQDLEAALAAAAEPGTLVKAGGIDVNDRLKEHLDEPRALVNIRHLRELDFVREEQGALVFGPLVTLARLADEKRAPAALRQAAENAATPQIRNAATLGGNLAQRPRCWYFRSEHFHCRKKGGDKCFALDGENEMHAVFDNDPCAIVHPSATATALVALGASLKLRTAKAERLMAAEQFFSSQDVRRENVLAPGELITEVRVPAGAPSAYTKLMEKQSFDWPLAEAAVVLGKAPRIVLGAAAPVPWRAVAAEQAIAGRRIDAALAAAAAKLAVAGARPLSKNGYKLQLLEVAVRRTLLAAQEAA
jgi:xanthine dehydrogenase YagS FAD-binding subunit